MEALITSKRKTQLTVTARSFTSERLARERQPREGQEGRLRALQATVAEERADLTPRSPQTHPRPPASRTALRYLAAPGAFTHGWTGRGANEGWGDRKWGRKSRTRDPPEPARARRASRPGEEGWPFSDSKEGGGQAGVPPTQEEASRDLAGRRGLRKAGASEDGCSAPGTRPGLASLPRPPCPLGNGDAASWLPTSELNSFSLPTEMFRSRALPGAPLNSRQPPRPRAPPTEQVSGRDWLKTANGRPTGAEASLVLCCHWPPFLSIKYTFRPCCLSGPLDWPDAFPKALRARVGVTTLGSGRQGEAPRAKWCSGVPSKRAEHRAQHRRRRRKGHSTAACCKKGAVIGEQIHEKLCKSLYLRKLKLKWRHSPFLVQ